MDQSYYLFDNLCTCGSLTQEVRVLFAGAAKQDDDKYKLNFLLIYNNGSAMTSMAAEYTAVPGDRLRLGHGMQMQYDKKGNGKLDGKSDPVEEIIIRGIQPDCLDISF